MSIFQNSFFSFAGQKERLQNVASVLSISVNPFSKDKVSSNASSPTVKAATAFVANNPYTTAAVVATGGSAAGRSVVATAVSKLSTGTKVIASIAAIPIATALGTSSRARSTAINTASDLTPEKLAKFGNRVGTAIEKPNLQNLKDAAFENKTLVAAGAVAAVAAGGTAALGALSTYQNTQAVKANTQAAEATIVNVPKADPVNVTVNVPPNPVQQGSTTSTTNTLPVQDTATAPVAVAPTPTTKTKKKAKKKAKKKPKKKTKKNIKKKPKKKKNVRSKRTKSKKKASKKNSKNRR